MVLRPQAWPFRRSASVHTTVCQSGAKISRAPALASSMRFPAGSHTYKKNVCCTACLCGPVWNRDSVLQENVGGLQDVFALVDGERHMMKPAGSAGQKSRVYARSYDLLLTVNQHPPVVPSSSWIISVMRLPNAAGTEQADGVDITRQEIDVVETARSDTAVGRPLGFVIEGRPHLRSRFIAPRLIVDLELMAIGVAEAIGGPMAEVTFVPADPGA